MIEHLLIYGTIRLSLLCYFLTLLCWLIVSPESQSAKRWLRAMWTTGLLLLLAHVAAVFHFVHHWRHELAVEHTARETQAVIGREFGAGVYFNYLFAALWAADVAWWWLAPARRRHSKVFSILLHAYLLFLVINSVIVFETGALRWCGIVAMLVLLVLATFRLRRLSSHQRVPHQPP